MKEGYRQLRKNLTGNDSVEPGTHHVETVMVQNNTAEEISVLLEQAYANINQQATQHGMVIVSTIQQCVSLAGGGIVYNITVHWVKRETLESAQRQNNLVQGILRNPGGTH